MKYYMAPMEGITGYIYRNAHKNCYGAADKYFTPFIMPNSNRCMNAKETRDVLPEHNRDMYTVPQILTNSADDFIRTAEELKDMGYQEINLNLGCPSRTVVTKKKGAGFLEDPDLLDRFLDKIFEALTMDISIKTRIGIEEEHEFEDLIRIYNKYPVKELIVHPRLQQDYYKNTPHLNVLEEAMEVSKNTICYNGDLFTKGDLLKFMERFPEIDAVMMGRGILTQPYLLDMIRTGDKTDLETFSRFHEALCAGYCETISGDKNVLYKMKELWFYMIHMFPDSGKYAKRIKKAQRLVEYKAVVEELFRTRPLEPLDRKWV